MNIDKGPRTASNFSRPALFYGSAREGLEDLLAHLRSATSGRVLLPAFIGWSPREGSGVFDPISALGLEASFYRVNRDLTVDLNDFEAQLGKSVHRAVVIIHYYGRTDPSLAEVHQLTSRAGTPLIEDLAHGFFSAERGRSCGSTGEASLFSLHKMLPLGCGGLVRYQDPSLLGGQTSTRPDLALDLLSYDWQAIARRRRANFEELTRLLLPVVRARDDLELVWPSLGEDDVPQSLPLYVLNDSRDLVYEDLNSAGFGAVSLYHSLIPSLRGGYPGSHWSAAHILNLPVHQDVERSRLPEMVASLVDSLDRRRCPVC